VCVCVCVCVHMFTYKIYSTYMIYIKVMMKDVR
jgi:hypothetical protein